MRQRMRTLVFSAATIFVGANGMKTMLNPGDRLYDEYASKHIAVDDVDEWINTEEPRTMDLEISRRMFTNITKCYPTSGKHKQAMRYEAASNYLRLLQTINTNKRRKALGIT